MQTESLGVPINKRMQSLDFFRGLIMFLLVIESTGLFKILYLNSKDSFLEYFFVQFQHHQWNGLRFWDLIQPGFMFIAGTAMTFSLHSMRQKGVSSNAITKKMLVRCFWLLFWGLLLYGVKPTGLTLELWDVLTQLSFTLLLAYLISGWSNKAQLIACVGLLLITELLYRFTMVPDYDQPFTRDHNFGSYIDMLLMHKISRGHWVAINCIPTAVHTIGGAIVGNLLLSKSSNVIKVILIWGASLLVLGYGMDVVQLTPIIKRIATSSFTIASLGYCLIAFAGCYYNFDIKQGLSNPMVFKILGMNSIFIYLFFEVLGGWLNSYIGLFSNGLLQPFKVSTTWISIIACCLVFSIEWGICYFLYKKKIFFRL